MKRKIRPFLAGFFVVAAATIFGCAKLDQTNSQSFHHVPVTRQYSQSNAGGLTAKQYQQLAKLNYQSGKNILVLVNHNNSTLNKSAWREKQIHYSSLDPLNRAGTATAMLDKTNIAQESYRVRQFVKPTGWHGNHPGQEIYNRGHLIAYSLSGGFNQHGEYTGRTDAGDQNNPLNLFTQTAFTNQKVQTYYEDAVREALESGEKVIYQVTPIFRGKELMARGVNIQAISSSGMLNFNVYIFNVQPGYSFNYYTGSAIRDRNMRVIFKQ